MEDPVIQAGVVTQMTIIMRYDNNYAFEVQEQEMLLQINTI